MHLHRLIQSLLGKGIRCLIHFPKDMIPRHATWMIWTHLACIILKASIESVSGILNRRILQKILPWWQMFLAKPRMYSPLPTNSTDWSVKISIRLNCLLQIVYLDQFIASGFNVLADIFKIMRTILKNVFVPSSPNTVQSNNKGCYIFLMCSPICKYVHIHPSSSSSKKFVSRL